MKASLAAVAWVTVTVVDVAVVSPEEVAWTSGSGDGHLQEKAATPGLAFLVSVAPAESGPPAPQAAQNSIPAVLVVHQVPEVSST